MIRMVSLVFGATLIIASVQSTAATIANDYVLHVPIDGGLVGGYGSVGLNGYDDWTLDVSPDGRDAQVTSIAVQFTRDPGSLQLFTRDAGSTDADGWVAQGGPVRTTGGFIQIAALTFMALDAFDYVLRVTGTAGFVGTSYVLGVEAVSPVPLPAAGWLFLSALAGGAWLSRRRRTAVQGGPEQGPLPV